METQPAHKMERADQANNDVPKNQRAQQRCSRERHPRYDKGGALISAHCRERQQRKRHQQNDRINTGAVAEPGGTSDLPREFCGGPIKNWRDALPYLLHPTAATGR